MEISRAFDYVNNGNYIALALPLASSCGGALVHVTGFTSCTHHVTTRLTDGMTLHCQCFCVVIVVVVIVNFIITIIIITVVTVTVYF